MLESFEHLPQFSTFHLAWSEEKETHTPAEEMEKLENLTILTQSFKELCHFTSSRKPIGQKCFVILGFKLLGGGDYFLSNWKELSGLGNLLFFLSPTFLVGHVKLLQNIKPLHLVGDMFNYMVIVEVFYQKDKLIYLLDYVQRAREERNTGHASVYHKMEIGMNENPL